MTASADIPIRTWIKGTPRRGSAGLRSNQRQRNLTVLQPCPRTAAAANAVGGVIPRCIEDAAGENVPAKETVIARGACHGIRVVGQDLVANRGQPVAKHLADVGVIAAALDDLL